VNWPPAPRHRRAAIGLLTLIVAAGVALLVTAGLHGTLVYYRTPSELATRPATGQRVRLGGQVVPGSVRREGPLTRFDLTDGERRVVVVQRGGVRGTLREGEGAVVEGSLATDGVFHADRVEVKHSNEYRAPGADPTRAGAG
jgi:cytochrome c-type biogenesis protein CcmE